MKSQVAEVWYQGAGGPKAGEVSRGTLPEESCPPSIHHSSIDWPVLSAEPQEIKQAEDAVPVLGCYRFRTLLQGP